MTTIKNLAFKGGGVLGIAYAGAIKVLENNGLLAPIEKVAGTSAGAITAALVCLNYTADEITGIVNATSFKSFEDKKDVLRIATRYGIYQGNTLLTWIEGTITQKGFSADATFADFKNKGCKDLHVFSSDLNTQSLKHFSFETTPNVVVAQAIRASMSIPMFFEAWQFPNNNPDNHIYVDGGLIYNYPLTIFDTNGEPNAETLGFYLSDLQNAAPTNDNLSYDHVFEYIKILFETLMDSQDVDFDEDSEQAKRTVMIDDLGISATDFDLTQDQETALYNSGFKYTTNYLAANAPATQN
jgi:NTE family protein